MRIPLKATKSLNAVINSNYGPPTPQHPHHHYDRLQTHSVRSRSHQQHIKRRSTKLDVIKSKIQRESTKAFRETMSYVQDSPFWWKRMKDGIERVKTMTSRLKRISSLIQELCHLLKKFSVHCNRLSENVMKSWEDVEVCFALKMMTGAMM